MYLILLCFLGCKKNPVQTPSPVKYIPFTIDEDLDVLQSQCTSSDFNSCERIKKIEAQTEHMLELHSVQMQRLEEPLQTLSTLLQVKEFLPIVHISSEQPNEEAWNDIEGKYPVELIARIQYPTGLERMTEVNVQNLFQVINKLTKIEKENKKEWADEMNKFHVVLPPKIIKERVPIDIEINTLERVYEFTIPEIHKDILPKEYNNWTAIASHVAYFEDGSSLILSEYKFDIRGGFKMSISKDQFIWKESPKELQYLSYTSMIPARTFCKDIRAEVRFTYGDEILRKKAIFIQK